MKKTNRYNFIILFALFVYAIINKYFITKYYMAYANFIASAFIIVLFFLSVVLIGYKKPRNTKLKKDVTFLTILIIVTYFFAIYMLGFYTGFLENPYSLSPYYICYNLGTVIIISVFIELFRYLMIDINKGNRIIYNLTTIIIILFEISLAFTIVDFNNSDELYKAIVTLAIPIIIKNISFSYISSRTGFKPLILYRLGLDLYIYLFPITPDLGDFLYTTINIILPFILYYLTYIYYKQDSDEVNYNTNNKSYTFPIVVIIIVVVFLSTSLYLKQNNLMLKLCNNDYGTELKRGDIVIVNKDYNIRNLEEGKVIGYKLDNKVYFYEIVEKDEDSTEFVVKDDEIIEREDIIGIANFRIPYIAYPIRYILDFLRGGKNE